MSVQLWRGKYCLELFVVEVIERRRWRDKETREMIMEKRVCLWNALGGKHDARYPYLPTLVIIFQPYGNHKEFDQGLLSNNFYFSHRPSVSPRLHLYYLSIVSNVAFFADGFSLHKC